MSFCGLLKLGLLPLTTSSITSSSTRRRLRTSSELMRKYTASIIQPPTPILSPLHQINLLRPNPITHSKNPEENLRTDDGGAKPHIKTAPIAQRAYGNVAQKRPPHPVAVNTQTHNAKAASAYLTRNKHRDPTSSYPCRIPQKNPGSDKRNARIRLPDPVLNPPDSSHHHSLGKRAEWSAEHPPLPILLP
ncbi:hypothetical protein M501DRAFT_1002066 [Patellaria atrata CBS 101060]|uniref:Uncharacterized protein n=1 Tax=Patellaria atrata CBS 101060 TaxID=1346257 RepID=A0A9P4SFR9_9PEZI|nr:hypothetical protein M501DRAFT_1002066 [Patellaria atrata CBS 101060]